MVKLIVFHHFPRGFKGSCRYEGLLKDLWAGRVSRGHVRISGAGDEGDGGRVSEPWRAGELDERAAL